MTQKSSSYGFVRAFNCRNPRKTFKERLARCRRQRQMDKQSSTVCTCGGAASPGRCGSQKMEAIYLVIKRLRKNGFWRRASKTYISTGCCRRVIHMTFCFTKFRPYGFCVAYKTARCSTPTSVVRTNFRSGRCLCYVQHIHRNSI